MALPNNTVKRCEAVFQVTPKDLQLDVIGCIGCGQDCVLIAGCGWGKTLVYFLPLILWPDHIVVVISPDKAIIEEQRRKLEDLGISAIALTGSYVERDTIFKLARGTYSAVFITPEIIFESERFRNLWQNMSWRNRLLAVVLDEAHCIGTKGSAFEKYYDSIGSFLGGLPPRVAVVALSAALPVQALQEVMGKIGFRQDVSIFNLGNDRPNIRLEVRYLERKKKFKCLDFLTVDVQKTIVYFETRQEALEGLSYLKALASDALKPKIVAIHSMLSASFRKSVTERLAQGDIMLLLSADAEGLSSDIGDIIRVIQFRCPPKSLATYLGLTGTVVISVTHWWKCQIDS
ncbi:hypothetical protein BGZ98_008069 [Dissophora globulifera]|nr:hypothetical protein BGZ98_008069 [Dissophora globulifera]